jgi:hypothetical protein
MSLAQLVAVEDHVKYKQLKEGLNNGNIIFLKLVREKIKKYEK